MILKSGNHVSTASRTLLYFTAEYIPQVYRGRFGRKHRFHRVRYFQLFVVITTVPTEE